MRRALPVIALLLAVTGCAQHWARPGGTPAELGAAKANCDAESFARFPQVLQTVMTSPGYVAPMRTDCRPGRHGPHCVTVGGEFVPPVFSTVDANSQPRYSAFNACMMAGGWRLAKDKEDAEAIARSGFPAAPLSGDAWSYCESIFRRQPNPGMMAVFRNSFDACLSSRARELREPRR
ncbi:MAG: hypothetical protein EXR07_13645 [Acetobacteraceae bacterium]|nr:hypothetical protein [Acetobacteraceae bacterium]